jgi:hypothetical protein
VPTGSFEVTVRAKKFTHALILYYQRGPCSVGGTVSSPPGATLR